MLPSPLLFFFLPLFFFFFTITPSSTSLQQCSNQVRAGFWLSHSNNYYPLSHINTSLYTHLYYSSLSLESSGFHVAPPSSPDELSLLANFSSILKTNSPSLKTLLSLSSIDQQGNNLSTTFSSMAASDASRAAFIDSTVELARTYAFDGLDLAWQFPSSPSDMANFGSLLTEWRSRINAEANNVPPLLLTASVYFSGHLFDAPSDDVDYPIEAMARSLDWINGLCFGYHRDGEATATDAALFDVASHFSTSYGITSWLDAGLPPCKLVMGIPLYGRSWFLKNKMKYGLGAEVVAAGQKQKPSNQTGVMAYFEVEALLKDPDAELIYDDRTISTYLHVRNLWVSFDVPEVVEQKVLYARKNELLGYFLWPISYDNSNTTISKLALDAWMGNLAGVDAEEDGIDSITHAFSPMQLPPQDLGPKRSASTSAAEDHTVQLHCHLLLVLLLIAKF